jgi:glycosyltransferase 2 family protein
MMPPALVDHAWQEMFSKAGAMKYNNLPFAGHFTVCDQPVNTESDAGSFFLPSAYALKSRFCAVIVSHAMDSKKGDIWKQFLSLLRVAIAAGLLVFLFRKIDTDSLSRGLAHAASDWPWLVSGIAMTFFGLLAGAVRWQRVLAVQGISFSTRKTLDIYFIGQFFNAFMLGACGGDVIRAYYAARGQEGKRTEIAMTILMDRAIGLFITIVFCCLMIPCRISIFLDNDGTRGAGFLMIVFLVVTIAGMIVLFRKNIFEHFALFRKIEYGTRIGPFIRRAYEAFFLYKSHPRLLLSSTLFSLLSVAFFTLACCSFGQALELDVPVVDYFVLFPIITVLMSAPLTPGSLGVREALFVSLFRAVFVSKADAIMMSLMVYAGGVFWSVVGGIVYLLRSTSRMRDIGAAAFHDDDGRKTE